MDAGQKKWEDELRQTAEYTNAVGFIKRIDEARKNIVLMEKELDRMGNASKIARFDSMNARLDAMQIADTGK